MSTVDVANIIDGFKFFVLITFRVSGMVLIAPFFAHRAVPPKVRAGLVLALAAVMFPTVDRVGIRIPDNMGGYLSAAVAEIAVGALIGFAALVVFAAVRLGGFIAGQQIGLAIAHIYDPTSGQQTSLLSQTLYMLGFVVFVLVGGHHMLLRALAASYEAIPISRAHLTEGVFTKIGVGMFSEMFVNAVRISAPAVITLMLATIVMAIVARTVPEMNIFNIGFAMRLGLGLTVMALAAPALGWIFQRLFERLSVNIEFLINAMKPAA